MDKTALRNMIKQQKRAMTEEEIVRASESLGERFVAPMVDQAESVAFAEGFFGDPGFCDPMLASAEALENNLLKAFSKPESHRVLGIYGADKRLLGLFSFLVLPEERYAEMLVGLSRDRAAYEALFDYLAAQLPGFDVDFVFNPRNPLLRELLQEKGASFEAEQQRMVFAAPVPKVDTTGVTLLTKKHMQQYLSIHNQDMYWTGEKVAAARDRFRTLLAVEDGEVAGYLDVTHCFAENEPFDLLVLPEYRNRGWGRKLLAKALEMNQPKGMMLLVDVDNQAAIRLYASVGFVKADGPNYLTAHWTA